MCTLILCNANAITLDPFRPRAELVAVDGNRIVAVAGNDRLASLRDPGTEVIDCGGKTLLPGFIDAHCHVQAYAKSFVSLRLSPREGIRSIADIQQSIRNLCMKRPPGTWVRGKGYNEFYLAENRHPNRWDLDAAAPLHPVKLTHRSGHAHVLNSLALQRAGISDEAGDAPGGLIDRDPATGAITGILYGMGAHLAEKIPPYDAGEIERGLNRVDENLLSRGITSVQDASASNDLNRWAWLDDVKSRNLFKPRVAMMMGRKGFDEWRTRAFSSGLRAEDLKTGGVKIIAGQVSGDLNPSQEELNDQVSTIHEAGLQAVIHAVEEPVIEAACDAVAFALGRSPRPDHRHRIEHCSICPPPLIRKLARLGIAVVTQPSFIYQNGDRYLAKVPADQQPHLYPVGSLLRNGLIVGASSDFPVPDPNPLIGIGAAVTRMTEGGNRVVAEQRVTVHEALILHTLGAAAAGFEEGIKGSISPGKLADLVMLDRDPFAVESEQIRHIKVRMTILDGKVVWAS